MTHAWMARVLLYLKQRDEAVASARRARELVTRDAPEADIALIDAVLAEAQGDLKAAEPSYRRVAALRTGSPTGAVEIAEFLQRQNRNQEAVAAYREVLRQDREAIRPHVDLCQLYWWLDQRPLGEEEGQTALAKYREVGNRVGEAQALMCLGDFARRQGGTHLGDARQKIEAARAIFESLQLPYGLSRVYQYLGVVAGMSGDNAEAVRLFNESLAKSRQTGNRDMEALELMNLGVAHQNMGQRGRALEYYRQSRDLYEQSGDELSSAEQDVNIATLQIDVGLNPSETLRRLANARAILKTSGSTEFDIAAMQTHALSRIYSGYIRDGQRELISALSLARERQLNDWIVPLTVNLAEVDIQRGAYEGARTRLEPLAATGESPNLRVDLALGTALTRLGDLANARRLADTVLNEVEKNGRLALAPPAYLLSGQIEYEADRPMSALSSFKLASAAWTDDLPDAASVEASCFEGALLARTGKVAEGLQRLEKGLTQAKRMQRVALEARCRIFSASDAVARSRFSDARSSLAAVPAAGDREIGPELEAVVRYWRYRALEGLGDPGAGAELSTARRLAATLRSGIPTARIESFERRPEIKLVLPSGDVRN
jgi:tetratricopeptide (TPR) repeat protein